MTDAPSDVDYLGDSVYVEYDGYHIILETRNGLPDDPSNRIALEPDVMQALVRYAIARGLECIGGSNG
jgi:hypothetical protein